MTVCFLYLGPFRLGRVGKRLQWHAHPSRDFWSGWHFGFFAA